MTWPKNWNHQSTLFIFGVMSVQGSFAQNMFPSFSFSPAEINLTWSYGEAHHFKGLYWFIQGWKKTGSSLYERYFLEYFSTNEERLFRTFSGNLTGLKLKSLSFMTATFFQDCSSCEIMLEQESVVNSFPSLLCVKSF